MNTSQDVANAVKNAVAASCQAAGISTPAQVVVGFAPAPEMQKIIGNGQGLVTVWPHKAKSVTRYRPELVMISGIDVPLKATVSYQVGSATITFSGSTAPGLNVHVVFENTDVLYQVKIGDSLQSVAWQIMTGINGRSLPGVNASASGDSVTIPNVSSLKCNVGGSGLMAMEVARLSRLIEVIVWAPDPFIRYAFTEAITGSPSGIGGVDNSMLTLPSGAAVSPFLFIGDDFVEESQSSYSLYEQHLYFQAEYPVLKVVQATQIGVVESTQVMTNGVKTISESTLVGG